MAEDRSPRTLALFCLVIALVELASSAGLCFLTFELLSFDEAIISGLIVELALSVFVLIALFGIYRMRWWGVYLFIALDTLQILRQITAGESRIFGFVFSSVILIMMVTTILPYRERLR